MSKEHFLKHTWNYLSSQIATQGLAFISIPIFTRLLTPSEYGILNIFTSYTEMFVSLLTFNIYIGIGRYFFEKDKEDFNSFFTTALILSISVLTVFYTNVPSNPFKIAAKINSELLE